MRLLRGALVVAYPFVVFAGLRWLEPRSVALLLGGALLVRAALRGRHPSAQELRPLLVPGLLVAGVLALTLTSNDARFLLFVPALVNGALLVAFARSLATDRTLVETFARLREGELSDEKVRYCRSVTRVWCAFFALNAGVALWLALAADLWTWTLYNGLLSYLLVGALFSAEFVVRSWRFGSHLGTPLEPLFRRLFAQEPKA